MRTVDIHEATTNLSHLIDQAVVGEPFIIARAGQALVKVEALENKSTGRICRLGFLAGEFSVPADFDQMGSKEIEVTFEG